MSSAYRYAFGPFAIHVWASLALRANGRPTTPATSGTNSNAHGGLTTRGRCLIQPEMLPTYVQGLRSTCQGKTTRAITGSAFPKPTNAPWAAWPQKEVSLAGGHDRETRLSRLQTTKERRAVRFPT